jgi:hypothetical protein
LNIARSNSITRFATIGAAAFYCWFKFVDICFCEINRCHMLLQSIF